MRIVTLLLIAILVVLLIIAFPWLLLVFATVGELIVFGLGLTYLKVAQFAWIGGVVVVTIIGAAIVTALALNFRDKPKQLPRVELPPISLSEFHRIDKRMKEIVAIVGETGKYTPELEAEYTALLERSSARIDRA